VDDGGGGKVFKKSGSEFVNCKTPTLGDRKRGEEDKSPVWGLPKWKSNLAI